MGTLSLGKGTKVYTSLQLPKDEYYPAEHIKKSICIHHTVGGTASSTFQWWKMDPKHIGTSYIVGRDGRIFEVFPPEAWAWHLGIKGTNGFYDKESIGIELANNGPLIKCGERYYWLDRMTEATLYRRVVLKLDREWRGRMYFADYTTAQLLSSQRLVRYLLDRFPTIERVHPKGDVRFTRGRARRLRGVWGHSQVRKEKTDPHPGWEWGKMNEELGLKEI